MRAERAGVEILLAQIVTFYNDPLSCLPRSTLFRRMRRLDGGRKMARRCAQASRNDRKPGRSGPAIPFQNQEPARGFFKEGTLCD